MDLQKEGCGAWTGSSWLDRDRFNLYTTVQTLQFLKTDLFWDETPYVLLYSNCLPVDMTVTSYSTWKCKKFFTRASARKKFGEQNSV